jgi:hypothetical protein
VWWCVFEQAKTVWRFKVNHTDMHARAKRGGGV